MQVKGNVVLNVIAGDAPGAPKVVLTFVAEDGTILDQEEPVALTVGQSLTYGTLSVSLVLASGMNVGPTPPTTGAVTATLKAETAKSTPASPAKK
jgi:hypothetical protein